MPEPADDSRRSRRSWTGLVLVTLTAAVLLFTLQGATAGLYGYDGYFHIRYAQILRTQGVARVFPWWQETFLRDHYADKDFLYHFLLIPFTFGDLVSGAKLAAALFGASAIGVFHIVCWKLRVPWPAFWSFALLAASTDFIYRLDAMRPLAMAIGLALAGSCAIFLRNRRWAFAIAAIYPHAHISFHLLPCIALLHDAVRGGDAEGKRSFEISRWTAGGAAAGALLSPYLPNNLYLWWVQNVRVLALAWGGAPDLRLAVEFEPRTSADLLKINAGVFAALFIAFHLFMRSRRRASSEATTLFLITAGFLGMAMLSERFIEFLTPFALLLAAVAARDALAASSAAGAGPPAGMPGEAAGGAGHARSPGWVGAVAASAVVAALLAYNARYAWRLISTDPGPAYAGASEWMGANVPAGETIFHLDWDDFPQLFFFNPQFHYLLGLDPSFMYLTSPSRWRLWSDVAHADVDDIYTAIRKTFGCKWVFAIPEGEDFLKFARRDPRFFQRYDDPAGTVFFLADGYTFVTRWRLTGWYPDRSRRLFEIPLGPEPRRIGDEVERSRSGRSEAAGTTTEPVPSEPSPQAEGPASKGIDTTSPAGFVDMAHQMRALPAANEICGVAEATIVAKAAGAASLGMTTDDEFRVYLNGAQVLAHSPYRTPPPGEPGGEPATLDEFLQARSHVAERSVSIHLAEGLNSVLVKECRVGEDFGFFLRVYLTDGSPVTEPAPPQ